MIFISDLQIRILLIIFVIPGDESVCLTKTFLAQIILAGKFLRKNRYKLTKIRQI